MTCDGSGRSTRSPNGVRSPLPPSTSATPSRCCPTMSPRRKPSMGSHRSTVAPDRFASPLPASDSVARRRGARICRHGRRHLAVTGRRSRAARSASARSVSLAPPSSFRPWPASSRHTPTSRSASNKSIRPTLSRRVRADLDLAVTFSHRTGAAPFADDAFDWSHLGEDPFRLVLARRTPPRRRQRVRLAELAHERSAPHPAKARASSPTTRCSTLRRGPLPAHHRLHDQRRHRRSCPRRRRAGHRHHGRAHHPPYRHQRHDPPPPRDPCSLAKDHCHLASWPARPCGQPMLPLLADAAAAHTSPALRRQREARPFR